MVAGLMYLGLGGGLELLEVGLEVGRAVDRDAGLREVLLESLLELDGLLERSFGSMPQTASISGFCGEVRHSHYAAVFLSYK